MDYSIIQKREDYNGIRCDYNILPNDMLSAEKSSFPVGILYTPLKQILDQQQDGSYQPRQPLQYEPTRCMQCKTVLNPYAKIDYVNRKWLCPKCQQWQTLPAMYSSNNENSPPYENHPEMTTVEYVVNSQPITVANPIFLFVVDTCNSQKEHEHLKDILIQALSNIPSNSLVGLITYGSTINVHELTYSDFSRVYTFSGNKVFDSNELGKKLHINRGPQGEVYTSLIVPYEQADAVFNSILDKLQVDPLPVGKGERAVRCTGAALHMAVTLLKATYSGAGAQVLLFTSGPITKGPGQMATMKRSEPVRQHEDLFKGTASLSLSAQSFFNDLGKTAADSNVVVNYISACFEESGLFEVQPVVEMSGGWLLSGESWNDTNIGQTINKYFTTIYQAMGVDMTIKVRMTAPMKCAGCIGPCIASNNPGGDGFTSKPIGVGKTMEWRSAGALPTTTFAFYLDITNSRTAPVPEGACGFIQFETVYRHLSTGQVRARITSHGIQYGDFTNHPGNIAASFDQEAGMVLLAKRAMWMLKEEEPTEVIRYIDKTLINFSRAFGTKNKGEPDSFSLLPNISILPQFVYHFRRSSFMSTFNASPDLTASLRHQLKVEDTTNSLFMIQPSLMQYKMGMQPQPVFLDMSSLQPDCVLLLDTFFRVLVWSGQTIAAWRSQGYQDMPGYEPFKALLTDPLAEAEQLIQERFPTPLLITCDQDSSLSRYLLARCNPTTSGPVNSLDGQSGGEPSYDVFYSQLKKKAVEE